MAADLKPIYRAATAEEAEQQLDEFEEQVGREVSGDRKAVARTLGAGDPVLRVSGGGAAR